MKRQKLIESKQNQQTKRNKKKEIKWIMMKNEEKSRTEREKERRERNISINKSNQSRNFFIFHVGKCAFWFCIVPFLLNCLLPGSLFIRIFFLFFVSSSYSTFLLFLSKPPFLPLSDCPIVAVLCDLSFFLCSFFPLSWFFYLCILFLLLCSSPISICVFFLPVLF